MRESERMSENAALAPATTSFDGEALPHYQAVSRFARSLAREEADAEDILQETYLRAYRSWPSYREGSDCRRWLFTICHHTFLRLRAQASRRDQRERREGELDRSIAAHPGKGGDDPDDILTRLQLAPAIHQALAALSECYRTPVVPVDGNGFTYEEVAELLSIPVGTVRSRLFRGRRVLQKTLLTHAMEMGVCRAARGGGRVGAPESKFA